MSDKELVIVAMVQHYAMELAQEYRHKASVSRLYGLVCTPFMKLSDAKVLQVQAMRNEIFQQVKDSYEDHTVTAGIPAILETFYFEFKDTMDQLGKPGVVERHINSIAYKIGQHGDQKNAYEFVRRYRLATNKYFYDKERDA